VHGNRRYVKLRRIGLAAALAALGLPAPAAAELVAATTGQGMLAVAPDGTPRVAHFSGRDLVLSRRTASGWSHAALGRVPGTRPVLAGLVVDRRGRSSVLLEAQDGSWLALASPARKLRVVVRPRNGSSVGPAGLALDAAGRPAFAYALRLPSAKTYLRLVTTDVRGRLRTRGITKGGFPSSSLAAGAAPVLVRGRLHVVETYTSAAIDWGPKRGGGWEGQYLFYSIIGSPQGHIEAAAAGGTLWSAWTQLGTETINVLLTLSAATQETTIVLDHGIFVSLALAGASPEVGAYDWIEVGNWFAYAGILTDVGGPFAELDGRLQGYEAVGARRQLLLSTPNGLEWFESPTRPAIRVTLNPDLSGRVDGATGGVVDVYREGPAGRVLVGHAELGGDGTFGITDTPPLSPLPFFYRAVYVDPATSIPYASLLRSPAG
jgi:hypothetical protein